MNDRKTVNALVYCFCSESKLFYDQRGYSFHLVNLVLISYKGILVLIVFFLADPGKARGCSINSLVINSLSHSVSLFLQQLYGAATPNRLEIALPVMK